MLLYFSAEGNTRYVALQLAKKLGEFPIFIQDVEAETLEWQGDTFGILFPVWSWGVPEIMLDFLQAPPDRFFNRIKERKIPVWWVMTCGDETGDAPAMLANALAAKGLQASGGWSIIMPNTYVLLPGFDVDSPDLESSKLDAAPARIEHIARCISLRRWETDFKKGSFARFKTNVIYPRFMKWGIKPEKWHSTDACIGCGRCEQACPIDNIDMTDDRRPRWDNRCIGCLACYHACPAHAVAYGNKTSRTGQYMCPKT